VSGPSALRASSSFGWYFLRGAGWVAAALALTFAFHGTLLVRSFERTNLDSLAALFRLGNWSDRVAVVAITESDYATLFGRRSPLDPAIVADLLLGIQQAGAAVIGVDLFTDEWPPGAAKEIEDKVQIPIVWVRDVVVDKDGVVQQEKTGPPELGRCEGPSVLHELSGVVREYDSQVLLQAENRSVPSFTRVIETVYEDHSKRSCGLGSAKGAAAPERELVPFPRAPAPLRRIPASAVLAGMTDPGWKGNALMDGRIVLLGGTFEESRDYHATPFERRAYGVVIQAGIVAADLVHEQIKRAEWWVFLLIDAALGLILVAAGWFVSRLWILALTGGAVLLAIAASVLLLERFLFYLSFVPVFVGVAMHFLMEHLRDYWKLVAESGRAEGPGPISGARRRAGLDRRRRGRRA
jgi:CHASE2 domain-containing sensor protein